MNDQAIAAKLLIRTMQDMSQQYACAQWINELEYALWDAVLCGPRDYYFGHITDDDIDQLKWLSIRCNGWIWWSNETDQPEFVPMKEWMDHVTEVRGNL